MGDRGDGSIEKERKRERKVNIIERREREVRDGLRKKGR